MEFPSFSNRYVPHRPLPPFPSDHNHHHRDILHRDTHHLPPPPFHPPPPPPPLYSPLPPAPPPPPPFNPHQSNFTFLSHHRSPPRVSNSSNRTLFRVPELDNLYPPLSPDSWPDPPRVSPYRPTSNYNPDFELNSRSSFRDEFPYRENRNDNQNQSQRLFWDRIDADIDNDSYRYKFGSDSQNSNFTREIRENYESHYGSVLENERFLNDNRDEKRSWGSMDMEHNCEFVSARRERDIYDSGRFSNRDREEREDFFLTPPKKQIQKKSVLLRIGKPNDVRNNRSHEQHFGSFRGKEKDKDPIVYSSQRLVEERERSPVDLDVSFKSNALVAKAIAAAHSSPARSFTPRNRKVRKVTMSDSPQKKFAEHSVKSGNYIHESDCPSSSEKTPKKVENVSVSGNGSVVNDSAGSSAVKVSLGDTASDEGHKRGGSGEAPSYRIRKKKKVASLSSPASNLKSAKKDSEPVTVDSSTNTLPAFDQGVMHLEEQMTSAVLSIKHDDVVSLPSGNVPAANKDESPAAIASEVDNSEINSRRLLLLDFNRNSSTHLLDSLSPLETEIDEGTENVCGSVNTFISNSDMVQAEFQDGSTVSGIGRVDEVSQQSSQNGKSILHENCIEGSSEGMVVGICNGNASLSTPQENKIHEGQLDLCMAVQDAHNTSDSVFGFKKQENITVYNIDLMDAGPKESSENEATNLLDSGNEETYLNAADNCVGGHGNLDLSKTEETTIHEVTMKANSSYYAPSSPSSSNSGFTNCQGNEIISNTCILDDTSNQACLDGATMIHENTVIEEYQKAEVLTRDYAEVCSEKDYTPKVRKRNVGEMQLDLSSPRTCDTHFDVVSSALDENTTLSCSVKDLVPAELKDDSCGAGNLHDTSQSCKDGDSVVHGSRIIEASYEVGPLVKGGNNGDSNSTSPMYNKKRKVFSLDEKTVSEGGSSLAPNSSLDNFKVKVKSDQALVDDLSANTKSASSPSQDTRKSIQSLNPVKRDLNLTRKQPTSAVPRVFTGPSSVQQLNTSKRATPSNHNAKSRTWHRTDSPIASVPVKKTIPNPVHAQRLSPRKVGKVQSSSYIRKGNSLVRKPAPVSALPHVSHASSSSVYQLNPSARDDIKKSSGSENKKFTDGSASWSRTTGRDEIKKSSESESRVGIDSSASCLRTGGSAAGSEMPRTPPLLHITKSLDCATTLAGDFAPSLLANTPSDGCSETTSVPLELTTNVDIPKISEDAPKSSGTSEYKIGLVNDLGSQRVLDDGNLVKKITYVKRKSNQLIATSNANDISGQDVDKTQASSSDSYYKRKNQLIRASMESHTMPRVVLPDNTLSSEAQRISRVIASRSLSKRQFGKAITKMHKPSKFSLVWRLSNTQSPKKDAISLQLQKERSHLFPWKRATYWQSSMHDPAYSSNNNSLSLISRKLLLTRKRDTIYTRSKRGFSLRISKLLSVGGSSLKWSKSIEKNSKRANEEATLAVAAVQKKKREQTNAPCAVLGTKSRNHFSRKSVHSSKLRPGERVFRIGSVRYKMDPTRRTLQRISEEEASSSSILKSEKNVTKSYVPRRLLIGNNEYVRIGNGNQLIRDPKKRTRTLASEKVRWSLHTARLRLARKSKYCQFFTRFGKCNKIDGKCPYIHDPAKIAVCTKFLNSSCSNPNCELTHKVIPERMQDCSYYLQGLCSNENCPYRHVNVNANASICEGFLKGYCADGNECRKKHTYVCPIFEATGICPQGSKCKLHHPKKRSKGPKRKSSREQKNAQGRYFGSRHVDAIESRTAVSEKLHLNNDDDIFCQEGNFSDYISLDISDEEAGETIEPSSSEQITMSDRNPSIVQVADLDELTRPIRIMYKIPTTESSPAVDSIGERTGSYISEESNCSK